MKIYIAGDVLGSYRAQNILKTLADNHIPFMVIPLSYYNPNISVRWIRIVIRYFLKFLIFPVRLFFVTLATHVVVLPMNSSLNVLLEILFARMLNKIVVVDYYISVYDTNVNDRKIETPKTIKAYISLLKDRLLLSLSTDVVFLNAAESEYYQKVAGLSLSADKCNVIPLCIDFKKELFSKKKTQKITRGGRLKVCWWGTYIPLHGLENIIKAFENLKNEDIELYLFGDSEEKSIPYKRLVEQLGLTGKVLVKNDCSFVNGKLAPFLIENCNLALGNFGSSDKAKTVLVNKLVDALSLGIPCLTIETEATRELLRDGYGIMLCDYQPENIAEKLLEILNNRQILEDVGQKGSEVYLNKFSPDIFSLRFMQVLLKRNKNNAYAIM